MMIQQATTMNNLMMIMTRNEDRRQGTPISISEIQPVIDLQQGTTPASTLTNSQYSQSQEQSPSSNKRPKHGLDDDETTALSTIENGTTEDMIEEQIEATINEQSNDVTMGDNDEQTTVETTNTANVPGDFSQFNNNNNNNKQTTTNTSAKTDKYPLNE